MTKSNTKKIKNLYPLRTEGLLRKYFSVELLTLTYAGQAGCCGEILAALLAAYFSLENPDKDKVISAIDFHSEGMVQIMVLGITLEQQRLAR